MDLLKISIEGREGVNIFIHALPKEVLIFILILFIIIVLFHIEKLYKLFKIVDINEVELGIGEKSKVRFVPNYDVKQIAYKLWVELNTRKLGLKIDPNDDVIVEIHESWYRFFSIARDLIKNIPVQKVSNKETQKIISISMKILNESIRTHLTKWQARFKKWYKIAQDKYPTLSPQELQKLFECSDKSFDCYDEMLDSLLSVNDKLIHYKELLEKIVF